MMLAMMLVMMLVLATSRSPIDSKFRRGRIPLSGQPVGAMPPGSAKRATATVS
jgi:hypothetical protein